MGKDFEAVVVCNRDQRDAGGFDEGDSGTFADRMIMEGDPFVMIEGEDDRRHRRQFITLLSRNMNLARELWSF